MSSKFTENSSCFGVKKDLSLFPIKLTIVRVDITDSVCAISIIYDLTKEKEREKALKVSEAKYSTIINNMKDIVFEYNPFTLEITYISPSCQKLGFSEDVVIGKSILDFIHEEDRAKVTSAILRFIDSKRTETVSFRIETASKKLKWFEAASDIVFDENGDIIRVVGVMRDITQWKILHNSIVKSEARYRAIVEDQVELISRFTPDGILTFVNAAYCKYFDKKYEDLIGRPFLDLIPDVKKSFIKSSFESLTKEKPAKHYDSEFITPTGETRCLHWSDRAIFKDDEIVEYQSIGFDITDRKRLEIELVESNIKYRAILDNLQDGFFQINNHCQICFVSNSTMELLGYTDKQDIIGKDVRGILLDSDEWKTIIDRAALAGGKLYEYETKVVTRSQKVLTISINLRLIKDKDGNLININGIFRDITEFNRRHSEITKLYKIVEKSQNALIVIELDGTISYANKAMLDIVKSPPHITINDVINKKAKSFILFDSPFSFHEVCLIVEKEGKWFGPAYAFCPNSNGPRVPIDIMFSRVILDNQIFTVASFNDTSERNKLNEKIQKQSEMYDELYYNMSELVEKMTSFNEVKFKEISHLEEAFSKSVDDFREGG